MRASEQWHHNSYDSNDNDILPRTEERHTDRPEHTFCIFVFFLFIFMFFSFFSLIFVFSVLNRSSVIRFYFSPLFSSLLWCCRFSVVGMCALLCAQTHAFTIHTTYIGYVNEKCNKNEAILCTGKRAESKSEYMCARALALAPDSGCV